VIPKYSIVVPVYNTPPELLRSALESIQVQTCPDWEAVVVDDFSSDERCRSVLHDFTRDPRFKIVRAERNLGISGASNLAASHASGQWFVLFDHDDLLAPTALAETSIYLDAHPETDYVYSDEDHVSEDGSKYYSAFFKPDWSLERLRSQMYTCHLSVIRASMFRHVKGFRSEFDGSQDHDLVLRLAEAGARIGHIPKVLYHWRAVIGSTALAGSEKSYASEAGRRAVAEHFSRLGIRADVRSIRPGMYDAHRSFAASGLSVVVPTVGQEGFVHGSHRNFVLELLDDLQFGTDLPEACEVIVVVDPKTPTFVDDRLRAIEEAWKPLLLVRPTNETSFNFSRRINYGVAHSNHEFLLLLNDDIGVRHRDWVERLLEFFVEPDVAATGASLTFENGLVQHAGIICNAIGPHHFAYKRSADADYDMGALHFPREVSAVTGAALAVRRSIFDEVGGLTEVFPLSFNDVDFCLKIRDLGQRIVWTPHARLFHFESMTRDSRVEAWEFHLLFDRWRRVFEADPYFNQNYEPSNTCSLLAY
jgi:O-antigen biosynthesis protein